MRVFVVAILGAVAANQAGWIAAEVGRQPWIVHPPVTWDATGQDVVVGQAGVIEYDETVALRTTDAVSEAVAAEQVLGSLILFVLIYGLLGLVWLFVLNEKIKHGPDDPAELEKRRRGGDGILDAAARSGGALTGGAEG